MILGVDGGVFAVLAVAVTAGALVQSTVGLGLGLVAAPVTALVEPSLLPALMLWLATTLPLLTLTREWRHTDWGGLGWSFSGRVPGTAVGVAMVAVASDRVLGLAVGVMVLLAVGVSVRRVRVPVTRGTLVGAGVVSGVTGTATSIGGPPLALLYQHHPGPEVRATLAGYFTAGAAMSLAGLAVGGQLRLDELLVALALLPCLGLGFALSGPLRRHLDAGRTRSAVLAVCASSAAVLVVRSLLG